MHTETTTIQNMSPTHPHRNAPTSVWDLFLSFNWLSLQGFGGVLSIIQRELVEKKKWLTHEEFIEDWAVAQILPGPNVINLSIMIGERHFGGRGAVAALAGMLLGPLVLVLLLSTLFAQVADLPMTQGALRGMSAAAAGLIMAAGLKLMVALKRNIMGITACALLTSATFIAVALLHQPLIRVLLGLGGLACLWTYRRILLLNKSNTHTEQQIAHHLNDHPPHQDAP